MDLLTEAQELETTGALFQWMFARDLDDYAVIEMDEYTIDIVVVAGPDLVLVFDTT